MTLKERREEKGLSQENVAALIPMSLYGYQLIERGITKNPRKETIKKIEEILKDEKTGN